MAAGWIRAIRAVPWTEVVAAAPIMLGSARKVLSALQRRAQDERGAPRADAVTAPADAALKALHRRIVELESDLVGTTEILKNLADQHAQLVATIEALRQQTRALVWTSAVLAAALIGLVLWLAFR